ncbi:MAG: M23 family metallopeptidase [Oscillospiraceae bacterium]
MGNNKKSFGDRLEAFFAGKGFYIVLSLCVVVIGVSAFILLTGGTDVDEASEVNQGTSTVVSPLEEIPELAQPPEVSEEPVIENRDDPENPQVNSDTATDTKETGVWTGQQAQDAATAQFIWPLDGEIDLPYSVTALIYNSKMGDWRTNAGVDIAAPLGTQVLAVSSGLVESVKCDKMGSMTVAIQHAGGLRSVYSNLAEIPTVYEGDNVMTGEVIGAIGTSAPGETAENPHLCFMMTLDGQSVNPADYLPPR